MDYENFKEDIQESIENEIENFTCEALTFFKNEVKNLMEIAGNGFNVVTWEVLNSLKSVNEKVNNIF